MKVGTVKEIKKHEYRVGLTPSCVRAYRNHGQEVFVETGSGLNAGFDDDQYKKAGATIMPDANAIFETCDMVVKVKEPQPEECQMLRPGQILYTYLHLAASKKLTEKLMAMNVKAVAYETIENQDGTLPCLKPMSEIAGRLSVQEGAKYLEKPFGGRGILLGGVPGVQRGKIAIIGGGVAGTNACKIAVGMGADVTVLDLSADRLEYLDDIFGSTITTLYSNETNIEKVLAESDLVIATVLVHGAAAPKLIKKQHLKTMKPGTVLVDVSIDQGGCAETSRPTTHDDPVYVVDGVVHYCVANMPGAVALSSTIALTSTTLRIGIDIAEQGLENACKQSKEISSGVNIYNGKCVYKNVAQSLAIEYTPLQNVMPL
jgi:alanine dehydrogenase